MTVNVKFLICMDSCYKPSQLHNSLVAFSRNTKKEQKIKQTQGCVNAGTNHLVKYSIDSYPYTFEMEPYN